MTEPRLPLFWRALAAFLVFPVMVAGIIPWFWLRQPSARVLPNGMPFIALGVALLLWCIRDFYVAGKGTLAPWDPPKHLVTVGLYRYTRNPMYVAVLLILAGWALSLDFMLERRSLAYAALIGALFHLRVVFFEEPTLSRLHGEAWRQYRSAVPRWLFRQRPFVAVALIAIVLSFLGAPPPGWDYDPHPVRSTLRGASMILGAPGLAAAFLVSDAAGIDPEGRLGGLAFMAVGMIPYALADWLWRAWRRSRVAGRTGARTPDAPRP